MKIIITVKTEKGLNSTKKEIDKTVDAVLMVGDLINKKLKGVREGKCKIYPDGTSLQLLV
ncbi:hypothetical protein J4429_01065 [Candidatus Pacearchaeota archaeon]|nr:hypothetical protein [Candidatus Pacearchaeota archaeon]